MMTSTVQAGSHQSETFVSLSDSADRESTQNWLKEIIRPVSDESEVRSNVTFKVIQSTAHEFSLYGDRNLDGVFNTAGFNSKLVVVKSDTVNFNIHYLKTSVGRLEANDFLPLYSVASFYLGICWTWDPSLCLLRGIIWNRREGRPEDSDFLLEELSQFNHTSHHDLFPALLVLQLENARVYQRLDGDVFAIQDCQLQIGYHGYDDDSYDGRVIDDYTTAAELKEITKNICGLAINTGLTAMCLQRLLQLADFLLDILQESMGETQSTENVNSGKSPLYAIMRQIRSERRYTEGLLARAEAWKHNSGIMVQTLLSLTTQRDQQLSIDIARDSRTLASEAKRDSTSMKAIAAVTMCFLPGTFMASLFAMPMFDWSVDATRHVSSQFWIYWVVTLPLTLVVILAWLLWTKYSELSRTRLKESGKEKDV